MSGLTDNLDSIAEDIRSKLTAKDAAREKVLPLCRETIRYASQAIRTLHRQEFQQAEELLKSARKLLEESKQVLADVSELSNIGFLHDAQKEFAEGRITLALVMGKSLPGRMVRSESEAEN